MKKFTVGERAAQYGRTMFARRLLLALLLALAALPVTDAGAAGKRRVGLTAFSSCAGLRAYALRHAPPPAPRPPVVPLRGIPVIGVGEESPGAAAPPTPQSDGGDSSSTNVQEAGIDEPDIVKNDGSRIFALVRGTLHAIDARAATPRLLDSLALPDAYGAEMLMAGSRVLVISPAGGETRITEVDISDPGALRIVHTLTASGGFVSARQHEGTARIVLSWTPPAVRGPVLMARARRPSSGKGWVPSALLKARRSGRARRRALVSCRRVRHTATFSGLEMLTVLTVDLAKGLPAIDSDAVLASGENVYASAGSLYVATTRWGGSGPVWSPGATTEIHRWDVSRPDRTDYRSSGRVRGHLLNQFSMSEHRGVLRVATTSDEEDGGSSQVSVLDERAGRLAEVGRVGDLGHGEQIFAVRFIGDAGFVVTFRQTDPLYALDLSDPVHPAKRGELKLRGYSAYLHPAGDGLLIGVGQDATESGARLGTQLSLFDVSDLDHPVRLAQHGLGAGTSSLAESEHHAFLWWPTARLAVVPVQGAAAGFRVDRQGIAEAGRVTHPPGPEANAIVRSLVVSDRLVTLSDAGVMAGSTDSVGEGAWLALD